MINIKALDTLKVSPVSFLVKIKDELSLSRTKTVKNLRRQLEQDHEHAERFKVAVIRFDPGQPQELLRNRMGDELWVEPDDNGFVVYSDHPFKVVTLAFK